MSQNTDNSTQKSADGFTPADEQEDDLAKSKRIATADAAPRRAYAEQQEIVSVAIQMEHPQVEEMQAYTRGEKYDLLTHSASRHREELVSWIADNGLRQEVYRLSESNAFGLLFAECTRAVAAHLCDAPGVLDVAPAEPFASGIALPPLMPPPAPNGVYHSAD